MWMKVLAPLITRGDACTSGSEEGPGAKLHYQGLMSTEERWGVRWGMGGVDDFELRMTREAILNCAAGRRVFFLPSHTEGDSETTRGFTAFLGSLALPPALSSSLCLANQEDTLPSLPSSSSTSQTVVLEADGCLRPCLTSTSCSVLITY